MASNANDLFGQSLIVLRYSTLDRLGRMLNSKKILTSHDRKLRDWRGLAELVQLDADERLKVAASKDSTTEIITIWCKKSSCKTTVRNLIECLKAIDRWDVIDDLNNLFVKDCEAARGLSVANLDQNQYSRALSLQDVNALTQGGKLPRLNAMVLFNEENQDDLDFGMHVVQRMEAAGLTVFVPQRDLCAGTSEHATSAEIIKERCDKVVPIFSPSFVKSPASLFLTSFAHHVGIQDNTNKIIPIIYKPCDLPPEYMIYHKLSYKQESKVFNFWDKLLVKTFGLSQLLPELKEYAFPLPSDDASTVKITQMKGGRFESSSDTISTTISSVDNLTISTTVSERSRLIDLAPPPPTHDPHQDDKKTAKEKKPKKKYKKLFNIKIGKSSS